MSNVSRVLPAPSKVGGFVVSVGRDGASNRTASHAPAPSPASGPLLLADPPPVHTVTCRPAEGLDFIDAGFARCEVLTTYRLIPRGEVDGPWRAVLRAHAS
ncbi:MAG: hypothetical protein ACR2NH_08080 [Solirubrobacteraceae bacterium]